MSRSLFAALALSALSLVAPAASADTAPQALIESSAKKGLEVAGFAAGCYWCVEKDFDEVEGVVSTTSGFMGGKVKNPTYELVATGRTGHVEMVLVTYDPKRTSYGKLLQHYWHHVDFLDGGGQFCDRGSAYRPAIFAFNEAQKVAAEESKAALEASVKPPRPVAVRILPASDFTAGPEAHQDYYLKNPLTYAYYRWGCGRDRKIPALWKALGASPASL